MRRVLAATAALSVPFLAVGVAQADHAVIVDYSPGSGPAGTVITISDDTGACLPDSGGEVNLRAVRAVEPGQVLGGAVYVRLVDAQTGDLLAVHRAELDGSGTFVVRLTVPDDAPVGDYLLAAHCTAYIEEGIERPVEYFDDQPFTVTEPDLEPDADPEPDAGPQPSPLPVPVPDERPVAPQTGEGATGASAVAPPARRAAAPATPVAGQPTYTG